jgi:4'-phosphopantetheinyl transferase
MVSICHHDWPTSLEGLPLPVDRVDVWRSPLTAMEGNDPADLLSERELDRASKLKLPRIREQFLAARSRLRLLLGSYLNLLPRDVPIEYFDGGKPYLAAPFQSLHFNVSHSENCAVFAITSLGRVGVDLERVRPMANLLGLVDRFFATGEKSRFRDLAEAVRQACFFRIWTCKEAILKAIGRGVQSLDCCEMLVDPDAPTLVLRLIDDDEPHARWHLHEWEPEPGFLGAVAVERIVER